MIKINLLPTKELKRKKGRPTPSGDGGGNIVALFMLVVLLELGGLMYWYMQASEAVTPSGQAELLAEKEQLGQRMNKLNELDEISEEVAKQRVVFEGLQHQKVGPINLLQFISFALRRVDANMQNDEYRVLSDLWARDESDGAAVEVVAEDSWDPDRVWLTSVTEKQGELTIAGEAKEHEDVMTFLRRLKSGIYFEGIDLVDQKVKDDSPLGQTYVAFQLRAFVNYDPRHYPPL